MQKVSFVLLFLSACPMAIRSAEDQNLIPNPSFEVERMGNPRGWSTGTWGGKGSFTYASTGRTGSRSLLLGSDEGGDISWGTTVPIEPQAKYRLTGWIKTEDVKVSSGRGALLNLHNFQPLATKALTGTNDWTQVELTFESQEQDSVQINCLLGGWGLATGKAWYDDLELEQVEAPKVVSPRIAVDAARTSQPISKYVYGQFIEHLGRCIYGGIWAEMLEDRKFYYPAGARESPWKPLGSVSMVREKSFVGEHTPEISLEGDGKPAGLMQGGLGLQEGKAYVGRIWLSGAPEAGPVEVSLAWGEGPDDRETIKVEKLGEEYSKSDLRFSAKKGTDDGRLEIKSTGKGRFKVGTVSLMPSDNMHGMRRDTLALLRELDSPVYRWPGGNFVSGYNWKDGIGDPDKRPPRKNPAWRGVEHNDFGLDEFMVFCRLLETDPYIAVNSGLGDAKAAVEELEYSNGAPDTPMGKWRAQNGHAEPYAVKFWSIGNEMYGSWQLGHMTLEKYVEKHNEFARAMRAVDPSIQLIAVGDAGPWSEGMMRNCADHMDLISEHFYCQERPGLAGHVAQIPRAIRGKAEAHRRYRKELDSLKGKDIRIALDEWNYWYGPHLYGELGTRYFLKDGLGIAAGLNEYARQSDIIFMANYAQTVNVIGCIKTTKTAAEFETTGLVLKLYRKHFGTIPVATETTSLLDAQAAWTEDRKTLTIAIVNPTQKEVPVPLEVKGAALTGDGKRWQMADKDPMAYNEPGKPPRIVIEETALKGISGSVTVAPTSVTIFALGVK